jgi:hypothetical protein
VALAFFIRVLAPSLAFGVSRGADGKQNLQVTGRLSVRHPPRSAYGTANTERECKQKTEINSMEAFRAATAGD